MHRALVLVEFAQMTQNLSSHVRSGEGRLLRKAETIDAIEPSSSALVKRRSAVHIKRMLLFYHAYVYLRNG